MKLDTIYNELKYTLELEDSKRVMKQLELLDKIGEAMRKETCYKTTSKTRVNAIKKVASQYNNRPALTGYGIIKDYKVVTDSYHLIAIKEDYMPLPLVATPDKLEELGIDKEDYMNKYGRDSLINAIYPNVEHLLEFNKEDKLSIDINDLMLFIKKNSKDKKATYKVGEQFYNARYLKNIIDIIGSAECYNQGKDRSLYFTNDNNEVGLVLPCRVF